MAGSSERVPQDPPRTSSLADPTRDIRLPPLPGRRIAPRSFCVVFPLA